MERSEFRDATRVLTSVLGPIEKRTLVWLAHRLPARVNSDHLTALALAAMLGAGLSYWFASAEPAGLLLVNVWLAINWFGDSLDGTLARVRRQQRPRYGFYVDHIVDCFGTTFLLGGLAWSGYMSPFVALGLLVAYLLLSAEAYLATYTLRRFRISFWGVGPTELRLVLAAGNLAAFIHPAATIFGAQYLLFDVGGLIGLAALVVTLVFAAVTNTRALYGAEPIPDRGTDATASSEAA
jgi:phosphatidylglycerophosphate synthase